ncbi:4-oxalocrotonate tautomerase family protein [Amycolatopsis sp. NPDC059027]|uniref:tautomerase family protein n=1 Tax=unclassified Amycolatopsis TaxID=2618356 RepID=UPI00366C5235
MPLITVKLLEGRLTEDTERTLIERLTEAVGAALGPDAREQTWVVLEGIPASHWGIAGRQAG